MIPRYRLLAQRIRTEFVSIERVVQRAEGALLRAKQRPEDQDYYLGAAALDLHNFYAGIERLLEIIAAELDDRRPSGANWHRELLTQMTLVVPGRRPAVLQAVTCGGLEDYLEFRHVVRNVYTFNLRPTRVSELVNGLRPVFEASQGDLLVFADFLDGLATADEVRPA